MLIIKVSCLLQKPKQYFSSIWKLKLQLLLKITFIITHYHHDSQTHTTKVIKHEIVLGKEELFTKQDRRHTSSCDSRPCDRCMCIIGNGPSPSPSSEAGPDCTPYFLALLENSYSGQLVPESADLILYTHFPRGCLQCRKDRMKWL